MENLPMYLLRVACEVEWESEKECFQTFARETARFYAVSSDLPTEESDDHSKSTDLSPKMSSSQVGFTIY